MSMTENKALETALEKLKAQKVNFGFLERFDVDENWEVTKALEEIQQYRAIGTVEELRKAVKEEDVLKFYYIESEDKYVVGQRTDTRYYGEIGKTGITFYMSRYLPWGERIVAPETAWKEHTYPSEPKEIPFFDWLQGFMKKEYGGTVSEFRELKEKATAKKAIVSRSKHEAYCPHCKSVVADDEFWALDEYVHHCECGQAILGTDWSEGKE